MGVKGYLVGAVSFRQVAPLRIQDTGYSIQDTGIEGCKYLDAGSKDTRIENAV